MLPNDFDIIFTMTDWIIGNVGDVIILSAIFALFAVWVFMSSIRKPAVFLLVTLVSGYGMKLFDSNLTPYLKSKFTEFSSYIDPIVFLTLFLTTFIALRRMSVSVRYAWWRRMLLAVALTGISFPYISLILSSFGIHTISADLMWYFNSSISVSLWYAISVIVLFLI